jgi:ABC-type transporter Mla subunit MlaD
MATKLPIDHEALIQTFAEAGAKQGEQARKAVFDATLKALQGRELTLNNIRSSLKGVAQAVSTGAAKNVVPDVDVESLLNDAVQGMDDALLKAVEANRVALQQFVGQGVSLQDANMKKAVETLEKMEDTLFKVVSQSVGGAGEQLAAPWAQVLGKLQAGGTHTGSQATQTVEQLAAQMQGALRDTRAASVKAAQAFAESYAALASGVLIGMSDALRQSAAAAPAKKARSR